MKKTETEKNRADTILVFLLQHTSGISNNFLHVPLFFLLLQSPNSQMRKNDNSSALLLRQIM